MGLFQSIGSIFGGNAAAGAIGREQRRNIRDLSREQGRQEGVNAPFLTGGTEGFNAFSDAVMSGPGELSAPEQMFLDQALRDVEGRLSAQGLSDSGMGRNALFEAAMGSRLGLRQNRLAELMQLAGFGERGADRFGNIGRFATSGRIGARNARGEADAFSRMNMFNQLGGIGEDLFGSFDPRMLLSMFGGGAGGLAGAAGAGAGAGASSIGLGGFA